MFFKVLNDGILLARTGEREAMDGRIRKDQEDLCWSRHGPRSP